jgi:hypothetical protein
MPYQEFNQFCQNVWKHDYGYIIINKTRPVDEGKYIANFQHAYIPEKYVTGEGLVNKMMKNLPMSEMHLSLPSNISPEQVDNGSFKNTKNY